MRRALASTLRELAGSDPRVILMTADLGFMVLEEFADTYPERFFNVGVAEANMIGLATGLAGSGYIPFAYSIATFASMRCYEQIRNGPALHDLPVRIVGVGGGFEYGSCGFHASRARRSGDCTDSAGYEGDRSGRPSTGGCGAYVPPMICRAPYTIASARETIT